MVWRNLTQLPPIKYICGFCGNSVASVNGFYDPENIRFIYECPYCNQPTYLSESKMQVPGVPPGAEVANVPKLLDSLYKEARNCVAIGSYTAAVLVCRKMLMNIAVEQGAEVDKPFILYVDFLADHGYIPPKGRGWVDHIRTKGNEATHEIALMSQADAEELISFIEMLLKFIYEFPARIPKT